VLVHELTQGVEIVDRELELRGLGRLGAVSYDCNSTSAPTKLAASSNRLDES
jgi:hypothetical protein